MRHLRSVRFLLPRYRRILTAVGASDRSTTPPLRRFALEQMEEWHQCRVLLSNADSEPITLAELLARADAQSLESWERLCLGYPSHNVGTPELVHEIASLYDVPDLSPMRDISVVVPAEGILLGVSAVLERRLGHVVAMSPCYQSLAEVAASTGADMSYWKPRHGTNGELSFHVDDLEALVKPSTALIVLNLPHNPTGASLSREELLHAVALAKRSGAYLFVDEIYRGLEHTDLASSDWPGTGALPSVAEVYDRGIALSGMSKVFGMPGLRLGWLVTQCRETMQRVRELKDYTTICPAVPSEQLAIMGLRARSAILTRQRTVLSEGLGALRSFIDADPTSFRWSKPQGGTVVLLQLLGGISASRYCQILAADKESGGLMLIPSSMFSFGDDRVRVGVGRRNVPAALDVWASLHGAAAAAAVKH